MQTSERRPVVAAAKQSARDAEISVEGGQVAPEIIVTDRIRSYGARRGVEDGRV